MTVITPTSPWELTGYTQTLCTAIVAGSDDDVTVGEMLDYIRPVLNGMNESKWVTCCFEITHDGIVSVNAATASGFSAQALYGFTHDVELQRFRDDFPIETGLVVVLVAQYAPQLYQLLDGISGWLTILDAQHPSFQPFAEILDDMAILH